MKFFSLLATLVPLVISAARADCVEEPEGHEYQAPGPDDLRGPCPGLNALANHGWLPRSGRNITAGLIMRTAIEAYNMHPDVLMLAAKNGHLTSTDLDYFTLFDIKLHGNIEHDASLSRNDVAFGDNWTFNETVYTALAQSNPGKDHYDVASTGATQKRRLEESQAWNPNNTNTGKEFTVRSQESALFLSVMGDPLSGEAPKEYVDIFFREDRLPYKEGWIRPSVEITGETMTNLRHAIKASSDWSPNDPDKCSDMNFIADTTANEVAF